jgi:hypothetical protein
MDHAATVVVLVHVKAAPVVEREHPIGALALRRRDQLGAEAGVLRMGKVSGGLELGSRFEPGPG